MMQRLKFIFAIVIISVSLSCSEVVIVGNLGFPIWVPSAHETQIAEVFAEHFCRYKMSDEAISNAFFDVKVEYEEVAKPEKSPLCISLPQHLLQTREYTLDFSLYGINYTNYCKEFHGFVLSNLNNQPIIAIQHFGVNGGVTNRAFTLYYNFSDGTIGKSLPFSPSPYPPYFCTIKEK